MSQKDEFIAMFKAEAGEYVASLEKGIVALEKDPNNAELTKELNRVAHTLKGAARVFGYKEIQDVTHRMETIFEKAHNNQMAFTSAIANQIFKGLDLVKNILAQIENHQTIDVDVSAICRELDASHFQSSENIPAPAVSAAVPPAATALQPEKPQTSELSPSEADEYVRVPLSRVNKLLNLIGEMVINKTNTLAKISQIKKINTLSKDIQTTLGLLSELLKKGDVPQEEIFKHLGRTNSQAQKLKASSLDLWESFSVEAFHLNPVIDELQSNMKELRMLPLAAILEGLPRMVRDIAYEKGKEVNLEILGGDTELDKKVLEGLKAPLMHILRNAIDHGVETPEQRKAAGKPSSGTITLSAYHEAGAVVIKIADDGQGIDPSRVRQAALKKKLLTEQEFKNLTEKEILNLIFMNGFTTSPIITDISGRGIGLDIVRRDIEQLKGKVTLDSRLGEGTVFSLILPLTIAIIQVLLVKTRELLFALPVASITESLIIDMKDVSTMEGRMAVNVRGHTLPLARLSDTLGLPAEPAEAPDQKRPAQNRLSVVVVSSLDKQVGFIIDRIVGEEEVFIKGLGAYLGKVKNVSGATVLWTGEVVVILDVEDLLLNSCLGHPAALTQRTGVIQKTK
ncbi:MAG: chemotaxis protein CheA, partial [Candidatus Omnitrophica bacterium]|nr:chemotaxis protein CheA [Candidatus Omnitrophota bacterium]